MNIYELTGNFLTVQRMLEDDVDNQMLLDTLDSIETTIELKAQGYVMLDKNLETYSDGLDKEIERLKKKRDTIESKRNSLKDNLFKHLELMGLTEIKTNIATIKRSKNPPSVQIDDILLVPTKYQTIIPASFSIRKIDIAKDLKAGIVVPGCRLESSTKWAVK